LVPWFLVCSLFNRMAGKTSGQDLTLCRFEIAWGFADLFSVVQNHGKCKYRWGKQCKDGKLMGRVIGAENGSDSELGLGWVGVGC
jgi:hypothetical protein